MCLVDYLRDVDTVGLMAVTVGEGLSEATRKLYEESRYTDYLYLHGLGAESTEATAEYVHRMIRTQWGIIHAIPSSDNAVRYALCQDECGPGHHHHQHIHFICGRCKQTFCLDDIVTPDLHLPKGYQSQEIDVLVKGTCKQCSAPSKRA